MMYSYDHLEKEIAKAYREHLSEAKKPLEVENLFSSTVLDLLVKISEDFSKYRIEDVKLLLKDEEFYELSENMKKDPQISYMMKESDLPAIINRFAKDAINRHKQMIKDSDRTNIFRIPPKHSKK